MLLGLDSQRTSHNALSSTLPLSFSTCKHSYLMFLSCGFVLSHLSLFSSSCFLQVLLPPELQSVDQWLQTTYCYYYYLSSLWNLHCGIFPYLSLSLSLSLNLASCSKWLSTLSPFLLEVFACQREVLSCHCHQVLCYGGNCWVTVKNIIKTMVTTCSTWKIW